MNLVEVNHIGPEAAQARLASLDQMMPRQAPVIRVLFRSKACFGGDQHAALAFSAERLTDDFLRRAIRIDVRRVDQVDARVNTHVNLPARLVEANFADVRKFALAAHRHGAKCDGRHLEAGTTELTIFHDEAISFESCRGFGIGARSFLIRLRGKIVPVLCVDAPNRPTISQSYLSFQWEYLLRLSSFRD